MVGSLDTGDSAPNIEDQPHRLLRWRGRRLADKEPQRHWCQCCGCMDCSSGTAAMRCDFKSQQLRALSNWSATNLWLALARLAGFDAFVRVETCVAAAVGLLHVVYV